MYIVPIESRKECEIIQYITDVSLSMDLERLKELFGVLCTSIDWPEGSGGRSKDNASSLHSSAVPSSTPISKIKGHDLAQCEC